MSAKNINKEIIALFSGQSANVTTAKLYIELTGTYARANVLNQCVYWCNKSKCSYGYFYKTYAEWFEEIHIPERTLRRVLRNFEKEGWIETKIKKVNNINTLHIKPDIDKIIDSIQFLLIKNDPDRPMCPDGSKTTQKPCTKTVPTGHFGRSEPAKMADSLYIDPDEYSQISTTTAVSEVTGKDLSCSIFSEKIDQHLLSLRDPNDLRTPQQFLEECKFHTEQRDKTRYSEPQSISGLIKILQRGEFKTPIGFRNVREEIKCRNENSNVLAYSDYANSIKSDMRIGLISKDSEILTFDAWMQQNENGKRM